MQTLIAAWIQLKRGKGVGHDQVPAECLHTLDWQSLFLVRKAFESRMNSRERGSVEAWATQLGHMINKSGTLPLDTVDSWRQVTVGSALQKWYLYCVFEYVQPYMTELPNFILGFLPGFQPLMMIDALRMMSFMAAEWGMPMFVAQTDVEAAFESLDHEDVIAGWK
eukprot:604686-Karenia_brevis.AAC.1